MYKYNESGPHKRKVPEYDCKIGSEKIKEIFSYCGDFVSRKINIGLDSGEQIFLCWIDGLVAGADVAENIIRPLTQQSRCRGVKDMQQYCELIMHGGVYSYSVVARRDMDELLSDLGRGCCALVFDSLECALCFEVRSAFVRAVSEPTLEKSLKGAKDAFVETLRINTALVRRRICSPKLKLLESTIGRKSNTRVAIMYIDGVAAPETVEELACRLDAIDVDSLTALGTIEEYIVDAPRSPFPQVLHTERPDRFSGYLFEGRVGLLVDGIPIGLVVPVSLSEFLKVTSDNSMHHLVASSLAFLRYLAVMLCVFLPALYVAVAMYHQEMIPTRLLLSIIEAKQDVPFSTAVEVLSMIIALGMLQEAGLRLPNPIGNTISIIGVLIVGQSAVEARVVSPIAIIVVAVSGISSYTIPSQDLGFALRICRFLLLLAAVAAGLFGVGVVCVLILMHLAAIDNFGVNYTAPLSSAGPGGLIRLFYRPFKPKDKYRDPALNTPDKRRQR